MDSFFDRAAQVAANLRAERDIARRPEEIAHSDEWHEGMPMMVMLRPATKVSEPDELRALMGNAVLLIAWNDRQPPTPEQRAALVTLFGEDLIAKEGL